MTRDELDPRGLIRESYRIDGITAPECRSIFLDWVISDAKAADIHGPITQLLERHADTPADHPMTAVLKEGLAQPQNAMRRGGRKARFEG
jgi:hypothetical protein